MEYNLGNTTARHELLYEPLNSSSFGLRSFIFKLEMTADDPILLGT